MRKTGPRASGHADMKNIRPLTREIKTRLARARKASVQSLDDFRAIGVALTKAKQQLVRGAYLPWAEKEFGFSKQWCARLTKLASSWSEYQRARKWAEAQGILLGRSEYSVDGALSLIRKWQRQISPPARKDPRKRARSRSAADVVELQRQLDEALAEVQRLRQQQSGGARGTGGATRRGPAPRRRTVSPSEEVISKAQKIAALWHRGSTGPERANAEGRLRSLAQNCGYAFELFLQACGIESPVNWTRAA
jgi:hypothetical protein